MRTSKELIDAGYRTRSPLIRGIWRGANGHVKRVVAVYDKVFEDVAGCRFKLTVYEYEAKWAADLRFEVTARIYTGTASNIAYIDMVFAHEEHNSIADFESQATALWTFLGCAYSP